MASKDNLQGSPDGARCVCHKQPTSLPNTRQCLDDDSLDDMVDMVLENHPGVCFECLWSLRAACRSNLFVMILRWCNRDAARTACCPVTNVQTWSFSYMCRHVKALVPQWTEQHSFVLSMHGARAASFVAKQFSAVSCNMHNL